MLSWALLHQKRGLCHLVIQLLHPYLSVYALSLVATFISLFLMDSAQPALLYIVPCTLLPVMFTACVRGEFKDMWDGDRETQLVSDSLGLRISRGLVLPLKMLCQLQSITY